MLSTDLTKALESAINDLSASPEYELPLTSRRRIWAALGPRNMVGTRAQVGLGLRRRATLAILAARHVLSFWKRAFPHDNEPEQMLAKSEQYLEGSISYESAWHAANRFLARLECLINSERHFMLAIYVGFAAANAVKTSLQDEQFDPENLGSGESDGDLGPYDWDASYYAAMAYAGGASWEPESSSAKRHEFWIWYLKSAVPSACLAAS